jgi:hypothetical protein
MAVDIIRALRDASATQRQGWKLRSDFTVSSFVIGGNYFLAPMTMRTLSTCNKILQDSGAQEVRSHVVIEDVDVDYMVIAIKAISQSRQ